MEPSSASLSITCLRDPEAAALRLEEIAGRTGGGRMAEETARVDAILEQVQHEGDAALIALTERFDGVRPDPLRIPEERLKQAWDTCEPELCQALELAHQRILAFHQQQHPADLAVTGPHGELLGRRWRPVAAAGLYVPGGRASYPSTVLMNAVPAKVAGVPRVAMVVPSPGGALNPLVLVAAHLAGVDEIYRIGGAQAIAALEWSGLRERRHQCGGDERMCRERPRRLFVQECVEGHRRARDQRHRTSAPPAAGLPTPALDCVGAHASFVANSVLAFDLTDRRMSARSRVLSLRIPHVGCSFRTPERHARRCEQGRAGNPAIITGCGPRRSSLASFSSSMRARPPPPPPPTRPRATQAHRTTWATTRAGPTRVSTMPRCRPRPRTTPRTRSRRSTSCRGRSVSATARRGR